MDTRRPAWIVLIAALLGIGFTATQLVERIAVLRDPAAAVPCDVNAVLSCSSVLDAWQSSVILGVPNAFIGGVMFAILLSGALGVMLGTPLSRTHLRVLLGLTVFFALFVTWFMVQTAFVIGALCLWCIGITTCVAVIGATLTRVAARDGALGRVGDTLARGGIDLMAWAGWWVLIGALLLIGLTR